MKLERLIYILLGGAFSWIGAVAFIATRDTWLCLSLLAAGAFCILSPILEAPAEDEEAPAARSATPLPAKTAPVDTVRAGVDATFSER